jgi:hypothetical protein
LRKESAIITARNDTPSCDDAQLLSALAEPRLGAIQPVIERAWVHLNTLLLSSPRQRVQAMMPFKFTQALSIIGVHLQPNPFPLPMQFWHLSPYFIRGPS